MMMWLKIALNSPMFPSQIPFSLFFLTYSLGASYDTMTNVDHSYHLQICCAVLWRWYDRQQRYSHQL